MSTQPEYDEERPLLEHILELRKRALVVFVSVAGITLASFPLSVCLIDSLISVVLDPSNVMVYNPLHAFTVPFTLSVVFGIGLSIPIILYEVYKFMAPGLFPNERRLFAVITPASILLFILGASLAYFLIIPNIANLVLGVGRSFSEVNLFMKDVLDFVIKTVAAFGFLFQIPLILLFAVRIDFVSPFFLENNRLYFYIGFFIASNLLSPDPTLVSQLIITLIFVLLFEMSYRIGYYVTPRTEADIEQFIDRFNYLGPLFSSTGVLIGLGLSLGIGLWWLTLSTLFGVGLYSSQRFSVSLIKEKGFGNLGLFAPLISPLIVGLILSKYYSVTLDLVYVATLFVITAAFTFLLEKINDKLSHYLARKT